MVLPAAGQVLCRHTYGLQNITASEHFAKEALRDHHEGSKYLNHETTLPPSQWRLCWLLPGS
jgi:hypothetical protein